MHAILLWLALMAAPFWETKPPHEWSDAQLIRMLTDSPWAQTVNGATILLATARPMRDAEAEWQRRRKLSDPDFVDFMQEDQGKHIVVAIAYPDLKPLADAVESRKMEEESILRVGKKTYAMTGHFPPTPSDPYLRLVYPREIGPNDKSLVFELYLPGMPLSNRMVEFRLKELLYHGWAEI